MSNRVDVSDNDDTALYERNMCETIGVGSRSVELFRYC